MNTGRFKKIFSALRIAFGLFILLVIVFLARTLGTEKGRLFAAHEILNRIQRDKPLPFKLENLSWPSLRTIKADNVTVIDNDGDWLETGPAEVSFGLRDLLYKKLTVSSLNAGHVRMYRTPNYARAHTSEKKSSWSYDVQHIDIALAEVDKSVSGLPLRASLQSRASISSGSGNCAVSNGVVQLKSEELQLNILLDWDNQRLVSSNFTVNTPGGLVQGDLLYTRSTRRSDVTLLSDNMNLSWPSGIFKQELEGQARIKTHIQHTTAAGTSIDWTLSGNDLHYRNVTAPSLVFTGTALLDKQQAPRIQGILTLSEVSTRGFTLDKLAITASASSNQLDLTSTLQTKDPVEIDLQSRTIVSQNESTVQVLISEIAGTVDQRTIRLQSPSQFSWTSTNSWMLNAGPLHWNGASIKASIRNENGISSRGYLRSFELNDIPHVKQAGYNGTVFADWNIDNIPNRAEGEINVRVSDIQSDDLRIAHLMPEYMRASAIIDQSTIRFDAHTRSTTNISLFFRAIIPWIGSASFPWMHADSAQESRILARVRADIEPLASAYLPAWQHLRGDLEAALDAHGSITNPALTGSFTVTNGFFEDVIRGTTARDISIRAEADKVSSYRLTASARDDSRGSIILTGTYARIDRPDYVLHAGAVVSNFIAGRLLSTEIPINGRLMLDGTGTTAQLIGNVNAPAMTIRLPRQLPPSYRRVNLIDQRNAPASTTNGTRRKFFPITINTDIRVEAMDGIRINGSQLRSEWRGRGRVTGELPDVRFGGNVALVRGSFMFLGRRFTITRGEVIIPSGKSAQPIIFVTAQTRAAGANIQLNVEGPSSEPVLTLTSDPPLEKNEIVSRLLFGKSGDSISPFQIAYLAFALDVLEGGGPILQKLDSGQRVLGLDQLDVKQSEEESGFSAVLLGRRLNDRFYVEGQVGLNNQPDVLALEVELTPSLILRTETSPRIREGISINWRRDY